MGHQLIICVVTGRDRHGLHADDFAALDVVRGVADDPYIRLGELVAGVRVSSTEGMRTQIVAPRAVIGEGTKRKIVPEIEVAQFRPSPNLHVPRQQPLVDVFAMVSCSQNLVHSGKHLGLGAQMDR